MLKCLSSCPVVLLCVVWRPHIVRGSRHPVCSRFCGHKGVQVSRSDFEEHNNDFFFFFAFICLLHLQAITA